MKFKSRLHFMLLHFDLEKALELSTEIIEAEADGYEMSPAEDRMWERLTAIIESKRSHSKQPNQPM